MLCAVCRTAGTQVSVNAAGQATTNKLAPAPPPPPKSNVTGSTPFFFDFAKLADGDIELVTVVTNAACMRYQLLGAALSPIAAIVCCRSSRHASALQAKCKCCCPSPLTCPPASLLQLRAAGVLCTELGVLVTDLESVALGWESFPGSTNCEGSELFAGGGQMTGPGSFERKCACALEGTHASTRA